MTPLRSVRRFLRATPGTRRGRAVIAVVAAVACVIVLGVASASAGTSVPFSNHTVETVNPVGTTISLFDYWVIDGDNDSSANVNSDGSNDSTGINAGHQLKFNAGAGTGINRWTGRSDTEGYGRLQFVKDTLVNGYPEIAAGTYSSNGTTATYSDESLAYLFNLDSQENGRQNGKAVYQDVSGLFQLKNGYYVYNSYGSDGNYAAFDSDTNSFNVYDTAGVYKGSVSSTNLGEFFPFDSASSIFTERRGSLKPSSVTDDDNTTLNHHFGISMETDFIQPASGKASDGNDMVFEFSGDDDMWVYIDGVLVGDLGGIHEKGTLSINFATGKVHIGHVDNAADAEKTIENTTLLALFEAAGADTSSFDGDTFKDSTEHTLNFFFLERGSGAANLLLKFNLVSQPSSDVQKVDPEGNAVEGAQFELYRANENWVTQGDAIATGVTDADGKLVLRGGADGTAISFDSEHAAGCDKFVLKETALPVGYRSSLIAAQADATDELHLQYVEAATGSGGTLVSPQQTVTNPDGSTWTGSRQWLNGGYVAAKETITLPTGLYDNKGNPVDSGTTFAVILKRVGEGTDETSWAPVTGNALEGYSVLDTHGVAGAIDAVNSNGGSVFQTTSAGSYQATVTSMPGDIRTYASMLEDQTQADYAVVVYHTTVASVADATTANTALVDYEETTRRQFSSTLFDTNIQNRLYVQKVDDAGNAVSGATFELYQSKDVTVSDDDTYTINDGATPYDMATTADLTYPYEMDASTVFPLYSANHAPLVKGTYYLREASCPDGYELNETITRVIVDESGVYVDAGTDDDGVRSMSGPGVLLSALSSFGTPDTIDQTLTYIRGSLQSAVGIDSSGKIVWGQGSDSEGITPTGELRMRYSNISQDESTSLRYVEDGGERDGQLPIVYADTGINRMAIYQASAPQNGLGDDLGSLQLNQLFSGANGVQYSNARSARLEVTKTVTADDGSVAPTTDAEGNDLTFTFRFTLPDSDTGYEAQVFDADGNAVGDSFRLRSGDTHAIKASETIRVYDLKQGDEYIVEELTTRGESASNLLDQAVNLLTSSTGESVLPAGFRLAHRYAGGIEQTGTGNDISGIIAALDDEKTPSQNKLEFVNNYSPAAVTLDATSGFAAAKALEDTDWDGRSFSLRLAADDGTPMPDGSTAEGGVSAKVVEVANRQEADSVYFGDITYTKPGTYSYVVSEVIPGSDEALDGISYSAASYVVTVVIEDDQLGSLKVASVKMTKTANDDGTDADEEDVADRVARFTNRYDETQADLIVRATKSLADKAGTFPVEKDSFEFTLEAVGGYTDATTEFDPSTLSDDVTPVMPGGAAGTTATAGNDADGTVTWPAISLTAKADAPSTYAYKLCERPGDVDGMTYDDTVYYAVIRNARKGAGITSTLEYYAANEDGGVTRLATDETPSFSNTYEATAVGTAVRGRKTVTGRDWNAGEGFTFSLAAATDDAASTGVGMSTSDAVHAGMLSIGTNLTTADAPDTGRVADFSFGSSDEPAVTFNHAGTFSLEVREVSTREHHESMVLDRHTARATFVVTDLDDEGVHTGRLRVASVTYSNIAASSDADAATTDRAAFTNAYHATGAFDGIELNKVLQGHASDDGQFTFDVRGLWYDGFQTTVPAAQTTLSNEASQAGVAGAVVDADGLRDLLANDSLTEDDLGRVYAYRIHEEQLAAAGYTYDTWYDGDAVVLVEVRARRDDASQLYTVTTVLKGTTVTDLLNDADASALTPEKIEELMGDQSAYVRQYDSSSESYATPTLTFINAYNASLDYGAVGGLQIEKTLMKPDGDATEGTPQRTFSFIVVPTDQASATKFGVPSDGKVFRTIGMGYETKTVSLLPSTGLVFTQDDAGNTYAYTVSEIVDEANGYIYDKVARTVTIHVDDQGNGRLAVTTTVSKPGDDGQAVIEGTWVYTTGDQADPIASVTFTNTYHVEPAATYTPWVHKIVSGASASDEFTFRLTAADEQTQAAIDGKMIVGSTMSADNDYTETASTTGTIADGAIQDVAFSELTFNKPGTYTFSVTEDTDSEPDGWTYDRHTYTVTVKVIDMGGRLDAHIEEMTGANGSTFSNTYQTSTTYGAQGGAEIVKTLDGKALHQNMFTFEIEGADDISRAKVNALPGANDGALSVGNDDATAGGTAYTDILSAMSFSTTDVGNTYTFEISEKDEGIGGYTYDKTSWQLSVTVNKRDDGSLYVDSTVTHLDADDEVIDADTKTVSSKDAPAEAQVFFANSYAAKGTYVGPTAFKVMDSGGAIEAGQYTFNLYAEKADGSRMFVNTAASEAGDGKAEVNFSGTKFVLGDTGDDPDRHTVDLTAAVRQGYATSKLQADGTTVYSFSLLSQESCADLPDGVRPVDVDASCRVTLYVTDNNDGTLSARAVYCDGTEDGSIAFHNTRDEVKTIGTADDPTTNIDGQMLGVGGTYVYTINWCNTAVDDSGNLVDADVTITDELPSGCAFVDFEGDDSDCGAESFDWDTGTDVLTWTLGKRTAGSHGSVRVRVKITEDVVVSDGDTVGTLTNTATIKVGDNRSYTGTTTNYVPVKTESDSHDGYDPYVQLGDELTYTIGYKNTEGGPATVTVTDFVPSGTDFVEFLGDNASAGTKDDDGNLTWVLENVPAGEQGSVSFKVRVNEGAFDPDAFTHDITNQARVKIGDKPEAKTNTTTDTTSTALLVASKFVQSADGLTAPDAEFTLEVLLYQSDGVTPLTGSYGYIAYPEGFDSTTIEEGTIRNGRAVFRFKADGTAYINVPSGACYEVRELDSKGDLFVAENGFTVVEDEWTGQTNPSSGIATDVSLAEITNEYDVNSAVVHDAFPVEKLIAGRGWTDDDSFVVTLTAQDGAPMPEGAVDGKSSVSLTKVAAKRNFGDITYTKPGTYTYLIAEEPDSSQPFDFSPSVYRATVTVSDDGLGNLSASTTLEQVSAAAGNRPLASVDVATFVNTVKKGDLVVSKTVEAREGLTPDTTKAFGFEVEATDASGAKLSGTYGGVTFIAGKANLTLKSGQSKKIEGLPAGTSYTVTETSAAGYATKVNGVTGSTTSGTIAVGATDTVAFTNTFDPAPAKVSVPDLTKVLSGDRTPSLQADEFTFELDLTDDQGNALDGYPVTAKNDAAGKVSFGNLSLATPGTYHARVTERPSGDDLIKDDAHAYTFDVVVTQTTEGLEAELTGEQGSTTFTNTFTPHDNTKDVLKADASGAKASVNGQLVGVGDTLTYTISWANNNLDERGHSQAADVTVVDVLPDGVDYVDGSASGAAYDAATRTLTWELGRQDAGATGTLTFDVTVSQGAAEVDDIANTATVKVGDNTSETTATHNSVPKKRVSGTTDGSAKVGDTLTYTVTVANPTNAAQTYSITDPIDEGLTLDLSSLSNANYDASTRTITWRRTVQAGMSCELSFRATVNAFAVKTDVVTNTARVQVGNDPAIETNSTPVDVLHDGKLTVSKSVVDGDDQRSFSFTVTLSDGEGAAISGTFGTGDEATTFVDGKATFTLRHGQSKSISGLPEGATYVVTEDDAAGYATQVNGEEGSSSTGAVTKGGATLAFTNTYSTGTEGRDVDTKNLFTKTLAGRDWKKTDGFRFTLTAKDGTPMPDGSVDGVKTVDVTSETAKSGEGVAFDFGSIHFTFDDIKDAPFVEIGGKRVRAKSFTYEVREVKPADGTAIAGVDYDTHVATMTITVTDDGDGNLTAATPAVTQASGAAFINTYSTELDYTARSGVILSKVLSGRDMTAGQFAFTVEADGETAEKLGLDTSRDAYETGSATDAVAATLDLVGGSATGEHVTFTQADAGKTYTFTITETKTGDAAAGYDNDTTPRTVTVMPSYDASTGTLTATTVVTKNGVEVSRAQVSTADDSSDASRATVAFENGYSATGTLGGGGRVAISATKRLTGRDAAAGEFAFSVRDAKGNEIATASNQASDDGVAAALTFSPITYTTAGLKQMVADGTASRNEDGSWTIRYGVVEDTDDLPGGVTATASSFNITVTVRDNGAGSLEISVAYPQGSDDTLAFVNEYGTNDATVSLAGTKTLALGRAGLKPTQADIAGKFTFTIEPLDGAPAPVDDQGIVVTSATNDASGNVSLGSVTFRQPHDLDDVEVADDGTRTKVYSYRVTESGQVDGVTNDEVATRTIRVKVVEDTTAGTLAAQVLPAEGTPAGKGAFEYTNTYDVTPSDSSVTDQITVKKTLAGRDMLKGEFAFELVETAADGSESVVAIGRNAADGSVTLSGVSYSGPGTHQYVLREVRGSVPGVTYDTTVYRIRTMVSDTGKGELAVSHELLDASGEVVKDGAVTFSNSYGVVPTTVTLGASKVLEGSALAAGQFSFELRDSDGKVLSTAANDVKGNITFDEIELTQAGTYAYTVSEVNDGQANVTYDATVHKVIVTVTDTDETGAKTGYLVATVTYDDETGVAPIFTNTYTKPDDGKSGGSGDDSSVIPSTGDPTPLAGILVLLATIGAATAAAGRALRRKGE